MKNILLKLMSAVLALSVFSTPVFAEETNRNNYGQIYSLNHKYMESSEIISDKVIYDDDYAYVQSLGYNEDDDTYSLNITTYAYDPIGNTFNQGLFQVQFIVYCQNVVNSSLTFRKPVYYTQQITWFDHGLGNPSTLKSTAKFVGVWGSVGDPKSYGQRTCSQLTTSSTSLGTRYTGISEYYPTSMVNSCTMNISVVWNVKQAGQQVFNNEFRVW